MSDKTKVAAIIVAAGGSERMEGIDKVMANIGGRPVLARVLDTFQGCDKVDQIIVVMNAKNIEEAKKLAAREKWYKVSDIVPGGSRRQDSVLEGLKKIRVCEWIIIHDGARPLVRADLIENGLEAARETGAAAPAVPVTDTIKLIEGSDIVKQTLPRQNLRAVQTPQVFRFDIVQSTYKFAAGDVTDDATLVERAGFKVKLFPGARDNIKITTPDDLGVAEVLLGNKRP
jgi:2-C-methyl-D-erythritol 4-phosphate cytidylyltransferase